MDRLRLNCGRQRLRLFRFCSFRRRLFVRKENVVGIVTDSQQCVQFAFRNPVTPAFDKPFRIDAGGVRSAPAFNRRFHFAINERLLPTPESQYFHGTLLNSPIQLVQLAIQYAFTLCEPVSPS